MHTLYFVLTPALPSHDYCYELCKTTLLKEKVSGSYFLFLFPYPFLGFESHPCSPATASLLLRRPLRWSGAGGGVMAPLYILGLILLVVDVGLVFVVCVPMVIVEIHRACSFRCRPSALLGHPRSSPANS
jgi:hypothetical protein